MKNSNTVKKRRSSSHTYVPLNSFLFSIPDDINRSLGTSRVLDSDLFTFGNSPPSSPPSTRSSLAEDTIGIIDMALDIVGDVEEDRNAHSPQPTTRTKQWAAAITQMTLFRLGAIASRLMEGTTSKMSMHRFMIASPNNHERPKEIVYASETMYKQAPDDTTATVMGHNQAWLLYVVLLRRL